jgi:glycosyltransferase involved in cell wall biosynthesis
VLEAMGNGLAICASETGGLKDLLEHEQSALLSQPGQSDELASNINKLSNNPILRNTLGRSAHKTATSGFSWDVVVPALINAYDS